MSTENSALEQLRIDRPATPPRAPRTALIALAIVIVLGGLAIGWWLNRAPAVAVRTVVARAAARNGNDRTVLNASGYVTARRAATVSSKVTGKVIEVLVEEGMRVKEGQVVARLDDTNTRASLQLAQAQLAAATSAQAETRVRLVEAEQELQRQTALAEAKVATPSDFDHATAAARALRARLEQQQAEVAVAEHTVAVWQQQLEDTVIRAPFDGIATSKDAQPGEMISPVSAGGGFTRTGVCTVVDMTSLEIEIDVSESYINRVEPGQPVEATLDAYPDWGIPCHVIAIIPTADRAKSTVRVRVGFDKLDPRILPEMSVKVAFREIAGPGAAAVAPTALVPRAAVRQDAGRDVVLVVSDGRARRRAVTVASAGGTDVEISAGLAPGERVVIEAPADLKDGDAVKENNP